MRAALQQGASLRAIPDTSSAQIRKDDRQPRQIRVVNRTVGMRSDGIARLIVQGQPGVAMSLSRRRSTCVILGLTAVGFFTMDLVLPASDRNSAKAIYDSAPPAALTLVGSVRDFREKTVPGGHPDFEVIPNLGYGHYSGNVA